jgi:hypothetical protein
VALTTYLHLVPRLKKEYSYTSTPPRGLRGSRMNYTYSMTLLHVVPRSSMHGASRSLWLAPRTPSWCASYPTRVHVCRLWLAIVGLEPSLRRFRFVQVRMRISVPEEFQDYISNEQLRLMSNFRRILNVIFFLFGGSLASDFYIPTFRNTYISVAL